MREKILVFLKKEPFCIKIIYLKQKKKNQKKNQKMNQKKSQKSYQIIENESKVLDYDLFKNCFDFLVPSALAKKIYIYYIKQKIKIKTMC